MAYFVSMLLWQFYVFFCFDFSRIFLRGAQGRNTPEGWKWGGCRWENVLLHLYLSLCISLFICILLLENGLVFIWGEIHSLITDSP